LINQTLTPEQVADRIAAFLRDQWGQDVQIQQVEKIFGGASRETFRVRLLRAGTPKGVIIRRDPPSSLIDTERKLEYGAYAAIYPTGIPVPEPLFLEDDPQWLGQPFSVMEEITGAQTDVAALDETGRARIGEQKWRLLGELAAMDPIALGFGALTEIPGVDACAFRELDYWAGVIAQDQFHPDPIAEAAIRWLMRNPPAPATKLSIVHGDYRSGNFLFSAESGIKAILDWEMCHVGNPLEDLAWSLDPLWSWGTPALAGRLLPPAEAIDIWQAASGLNVDPKDFLWWRVLVAVKALAIWISSSEDFHNGNSKEAILAYAGWAMTDRQHRILLDYLSPVSRTEFGVRVQ
jgi:aminoglycoside phosphotransferase (APT) family kinase protein